MSEPSDAHAAAEERRVPGASQEATSAATRERLGEPRSITSSRVTATNTKATHRCTQEARHARAERRAACAAHIATSKRLGRARETRRVETSRSGTAADLCASCYCHAILSQRAHPGPGAQRRVWRRGRDEAPRRTRGVVLGLIRLLVDRAAPESHSRLPVERSGPPPSTESTRTSVAGSAAVGSCGGHAEARRSTPTNARRRSWPL